MASLKSQTQYAFDFIVNIIGNFLGLFADFIIIAMILLRFQSIQSWTLVEIAVIYSIIEFGFGTYRLIGDGLNNFEILILSGRFDTLMIRPASILGQVMLQTVDFKRLGLVLQACLVGAWGLSQVEFAHAFAWAYLPLLYLASAIMNLLVSILLASTAFWTGKNEDIIILGHYSTRTAAQYPATIYHKGFQAALTYVIPFFTVTYYPLAYLTGKSAESIYLIAPWLGILILAPLTMGIWKLGVRRYASTGT
jgi:ABC-2 type transport system permease protein